MLVILEKENSHEHGAFLSESGQGISSNETRDQHSHELIQEDDGQWTVLASGDKPHTHTIREIIRTPQKIDKQSEDVRVEEVMMLVKESERNEGESIKNGIEAYGYYFGDGQWDPAGKAQLESNQRAAITVNEIEHRVDVLCGTHDQNKTDIIFKPVEDGDEQASDIANMVYKSIMNQNDFHREDGMSFRDLTVAGRGCKNVEIDFDKNVEGDIVIRQYPWDKVRLGPHERPDQEDLEYMIKTDTFSIGKLKSLFPKRVKEIEFAFKSFEGTSDEFKQPHKNVAGLAYRLGDQNLLDTAIGNEPIVDVQRKEFKVFEVWQKVFRNSSALIFADENFVENGDGIKEKELNMLKRIPGMESVPRKVVDMRKTEMAGGIILSDQILDLPPNTDEFHLFAAYGKKYKNKFIGKVEPAKGLQNTINKLTSQTIDITNKMAAYGWFYDNETFENPTDGDKFRRTSAQAGFTQKVRDISRVPVQVQGVKFPSELVNLKSDATVNLDTIMGVPARANDFSGDFSTKTLMMMKRQSLVGNNFLFENSHEANKRMAKLVMAYVQALYTPERILRIIGSTSEEDQQDLNDPNVINVTMEEIAEMLNNEQLLKLDLVMSESAHTDTMKELTFHSIGDILNTVPDPVLLQKWIENSPFPNKNNIVTEMKESQAAQAQAGNDTNDSQTFASLPDTVKEELASRNIYSYKDLNSAREQEQQSQQQGGQV